MCLFKHNGKGHISFLKATEVLPHSHTFHLKESYLVFNTFIMHSKYTVYCEWYMKY